jgi:DNA mismatch repair protein MutL
MTSCIQPLPDDVVKLIAAGEVIDSLAAAVRELVENAIDAEATRLTVSVWVDLWRVQVADNGRGMSLADLAECAKAHSTSKIRTQGDLWKITSLGFRGEALHSLVQLGEVEIFSRTATGEGYHVTYNHQGEMTRAEPRAIAPGTIVTVSHLFGTIPVRRKGLPPRQQQLKEIQEIIHAIALCHPHLTWQVFKDNQPWFSLSPSDTLQQTLPQLLKTLQVSDLHGLELDVEPAESAIRAKLALLIGLPDRCHRHKPDWVKVATNGRMIKSPQLESTIIAAFHKTLPRDRYPVCFVHLTLSPSQIDWNRHPTKQVVYLHEVEFWQREVKSAIAQALQLSPVTLPATLQNERVTTLLKAAEDTASYTLDRQVAPQSPTPETSSLLQLQAVAQVHNTYIVAEHPSGLWLIEQHIAHERILYEQLEDNWRLETLDSPLMLPNLKPLQIQQLERLGITVDPFGESLWAVRTVPLLLKERDDQIEAILELSHGGSLQEAQVATACRSAIRNGTPLDLPEMQMLLDQWSRTRSPRTCPHGRPIYLSLEESSLSRFFKRHWVIGKSHGIRQGN